MIPEKNGIYLRNLVNACRGDTADIVKYAKGDPANPDRKDIHCDWIAVDFLRGQERANSVQRPGFPEYYHLDRLVANAKLAGLKVFLVTHFSGLNPLVEARMLVRRSAFLTSRSALGGVIVRATAHAGRRTGQDAIVYMDAIQQAGLQVGFWGDEDIPASLLKEFVARSSFMIGDVTWKADERPYTSLVASYMFWSSLGSAHFIPAVSLHNRRKYHFSPDQLAEYHTSLMNTDLNANLWDGWDPEKRPAGWLEHTLDVRKLLFQTPWTRPVIPLRPGEGSSTSATLPPSLETPDELSLEQQVALLWQDYLDRHRK